MPGLLSGAAARTLRDVWAYSRAGWRQSGTFQCVLWDNLYLARPPTFLEVLPSHQHSMPAVRAVQQAAVTERLTWCQVSIWRVCWALVTAMLHRSYGFPPMVA